MKRISILFVKLKIIQVILVLSSTATLSAPENRILAGRNLEISVSSAPWVLPFGIIKPEVALEGSPESLIWQNYKFDLEGLKRIRDDAELEEMKSAGELVPLPLGDCLLASDKELEPKWRFVLTRTAKLLQNLSETVCPEFGLPVQTNSAVRHISRQLELILGTEIEERNYNAAPVSGSKASPHLTGAAVDIAVLGYPDGFVARLKEILLELESRGAIDATLETAAQVVMHVTVFKEHLNIPLSTQ